MNPESGHQPNLAHLYREAIRRHAARPVGYRQVIEATHRHEEYNPLCGDRIEIALQVLAGRIEAAAFDGEACAICMASASLLCSLAAGGSVAELRQLSAALHRALEGSEGADPAPDRGQGPLPQEHPVTEGLADLAEELQPLLGVRPYPSRIRCATLPWTAALRALSGPAPEPLR